MLMGIKLQARPTKEQKVILCAWMGGAKFVWNAKCQEDKYLRTYARKYLPLNTHPKIDQKYSQYKDEELSPFLKDIPSQILRNSSSNWYASYQQFFKQKDRGRPRVKKCGRGMTILLTRELFEFKNTAGGLKLFIGTKKNNIGLLDINWHDKKWLSYGLPNSIRIKKLPSGVFTASFCYGKEERSNAEKEDRKNWFKYLSNKKSREELEKEVLGIDRGIVIAAATEVASFHPSIKDRNGLKKWKRILKRQQVRFSKQRNKISRRREKRKLKIAKIHAKIANIRENACHHITKQIVSTDKKVFVLEDLKIKNQTKSAKGTVEDPGKNVAQKSGLNREILNIGWHKIESQLKYKARKVNKVVFKVNPQFTLQECANCGHTHADNRSGIEFKCLSCGHMDHADINAARVVKKRAVNLFLDSGTELSENGLLRRKSDIGRGATVRPKKDKSLRAQASKRQERRKVAA